MFLLINIYKFIFCSKQIDEWEQHNLAIMQMVVVLVFVICNCLAMLSNILELFEIDAVSVTMISNFLVTFNSSVNLFIYCAFGERFRNEIKHLTHKISRRISNCCFAKYHKKSQNMSFLQKNIDVQIPKSRSLPEIASFLSNVHGTAKTSGYISEERPKSSLHECDEMLNMENFKKMEEEIDYTKCQKFVRRNNTPTMV